MNSLVRPRSGRLLAGVCAAMAMRFGIDVLPIRILTVAFGLFFGLAIPLYLALWMLIPQER